MGPNAATAPTAAVVDPARVGALAQAVIASGATGLAPVSWDDPLFWNVEDDPAARCQFIAVGNAINFRFWALEAGRVRPAGGEIEGAAFRGSMYMWRRLRVAVARGELSLRAEDLAELDLAAFRRAFADDDGACPLDPAAEDRVANLRDLGEQLARRWGGRFEAVLLAAEGSLERFAALSAQFRAFDDPVRKLTMVNAIMLAGSGLAAFDREPQPGIDYHLVKQALRQGLVEPGPAVARKLAAGELLSEAESLPLREATLRALEAVGAAAGVSTAVIDNLYWLNRRVCADAEPACLRSEPCPFAEACARRTDLGMPLELTRYY